MRKRIAVGLFALAVGLCLTLGAPGTAAQKDKDTTTKDGTPPKFLYGHDLKIRPGGKTDAPDALKIGIEVFQDDANKAIIGISQSGSLTVIPAGPIGTEKTCKWLTGLDLNARKAGEAAFTSKTKKYGVEVFQDRAANKLIYAGETGSIAFAPIPPGLVTDKGPRWHHGMEAKVRSPGQQDFEKAKRIGVEAFKDENTGSPGVMVYVTETGAIATATAPPTSPDPNKIAPPKAIYGLELRVRGGNEPEFTEKTKRFSLEVFEDPNANNQLLYITEQGFIAAAPKPATIPPDASGVTWKGAMSLRARKGGDKTFDKATKYGIEVFQDNRTGNLIFISDTGSIAVLPGKV